MGLQLVRICSMVCCFSAVAEMLEVRMGMSRQLVHEPQGLDSVCVCVCVSTRSAWRACSECVLGLRTRVACVLCSQPRTGTTTAKTLFSKTGPFFSEFRMKKKVTQKFFAIKGLPSLQDYPLIDAALRLLSSCHKERERLSASFSLSLSLDNQPPQSAQTLLSQ